MKIIWPAVLVSGLSGLALTAHAQNALDPAPLPVEVQPVVPSAGQGAAAPSAQAAAAVDPAAASYQRLTVDTGVSDVRVNDGYTIATMNRSPQSGCASNQYVFERDRPKWLTQTGRLLQAMKEGATVRISFSCRNGYQSINAIQFLSPAAGGALAQATPQREQSVEAFAARQAGQGAAQSQPPASAGGRAVPLP